MFDPLKKLLNMPTSAEIRAAELKRYEQSLEAREKERAYQHIMSNAYRSVLQQMQNQQSYGADMATPEGNVKVKVKKVLEDLDVYFTMPVTGGYGNSGVPDFVACIEGRFFGIECKAGGNKPTALQEKHLTDITNSGGVSMVVDETNVDTLKERILANLGDRR